MSAFRKLAEKFAALGVVPTETAKVAAVEIREKLVSGFASGHDAYGNQWPALASGSAAHLRETGAYEASLKVLALAGPGQSLIEMSTGNAANLHARESRQTSKDKPAQSATRMKNGRFRKATKAVKGNGRTWVHPARPLLPVEGQPLPPVWVKLIEENAADAMRKAMK